MFIAFSDEFVQVLSALGSERLQAEIVEYQQVYGEDFTQQPGMGADSAGRVEIGEQAGGIVKDDGSCRFQGFKGDGV